MADLNRITFVGRLGKDPEMQYTPNGKAVCKLSVANTPGFGKDAPTTWFPVECWGKTAEFINEYGAKGMRVSVDGQMICDEYEGKYYWKVKWASVNLLDKKEQDDDVDF